MSLTVLPLPVCRRIIGFAAAPSHGARCSKHLSPLTRFLQLAIEPIERCALPSTALHGSHGRLQDGAWGRNCTVVHALMRRAPYSLGYPRKQLTRLTIGSKRSNQTLLAYHCALYCVVRYWFAPEGCHHSRYVSPGVFRSGVHRTPSRGRRETRANGKRDRHRTYRGGLESPRA